MSAKRQNRLASLIARLAGRSATSQLESRGRLPADEMYPLGSGSVKARFIELGSGVRVRIAECGDENGRPVLLLHGWGGCIYGFRRNMPTLGAAGYRVIAVDMLGHGLSDKPLEVSRYSWPGLLRQVEEILDALAIEKVNLVGQSMSGYLALAFARARPSRVSAVAVFNATGLGRISGIAFAQLLARIPPALHLPITTRRFMVKLILKPIYGKLGELTDRDIDEYWAPSQYPEWGRVLVMLLRSAPWGRVPPGEFADVSQPTLVVVSSDPMVRVGDRAELQSRIPPRSTILHVEGAGHLVNEEAPEPVNEALLSFLAETGTAVLSEQASPLEVP